MNQIKLKGTLVIDSLSTFYKANPIKNNKLLLANDANEVVDSTAFELNKVAAKRFREKTNKYINKP